MPQQPAFPHREILKSESSSTRIKALENWLGKPLFKEIAKNGDFLYPLGIVGPLPIKVAGKKQWSFVPIATTEGALVASYQRGTKVLNEAEYQAEVTSLQKGLKVEASVTVSEPLSKKILKTSPEELYDYWEACTIGVQLTGSKGANGHFANGLTGLCLALGLPLSIPIRAALGQTLCRLMPSGCVEISIAFELEVFEIAPPHHEWQKDARELIVGKSGLSFEEAMPWVVAGLTLAGELSIMAAMASGQFAGAHEKLGRR